MNKTQIKYGALLSYLTIAFNTLAGLIYTPWMIKSIGDSSYALYALAVSIINLFLMDFGLGQAIAKFLSNYYARGEEKQANDFLGIAYKLYTAISVLIFVALFVIYFFIDVIYAKLTPEELRVFKVLYIIVSLYSVVSFQFLSLNGVLIAKEKFIELKLCNFLQKFLTVLLIVIALLLGQGVYALVAVNALVNLMCVLAKLIIVRRRTTARANFKNHDKKLSKSILGYSLWATVVQISQRCIFNIAPTILAAIVGSTEIVIFSLAASLEGYVFTFADALNGMFMPEVSRLLSNGNSKNRLLPLMCKVGRLQVYLIGLIIIGFFCIGRSFVGAWMGEGYGLIYVCTLLLILPSLFELPQQIAANGVLVTDNIKSQAIIFTVMAVFNIGFGILAASLFGVVGACVSICIAYFIRTFGMMTVYRKKLDIDVFKFLKNTYLSWLIPAALTIVIGLAVERFLPLGGWIGVGVKALIIVAVYAVLMALLSFDEYEKGLLDGFLRRLNLKK